MSANCMHREWPTSSNSRWRRPCSTPCPRTTQVIKVKQVTRTQLLQRNKFTARTFKAVKCRTIGELKCSTIHNPNPKVTVISTNRYKQCLVTRARRSNSSTLAITLLQIAPVTQRKAAMLLNIPMGKVWQRRRHLNKSCLKQLHLYSAHLSPYSLKRAKKDLRKLTILIQVWKSLECPNKTRVAWACRCQSMCNRIRANEGWHSTLIWVQILPNSNIRSYLSQWIKDNISVQVQISRIDLINSIQATF